MKIVQTVTELQHVLMKSPLMTLRKDLTNGKELIQSLYSYRAEAQVLLEKCYNPLKIVLMGEVKAGKSTIINTFAGGEISPTNVAETTASIIEISHAEKSKGSIYKQSGEVISSKPEEIYEEFTKNRGDKDYFADIAHVKLEFPLPNLQKVHLVDTPGLATVSADNEQTTVNYIQNSDVILWVFSAHHLGQVDIEEQLSNVKSYGKPVVAVINRLDEVSNTAEELEMYIRNRLGFFIEEVFAISAYQALEGVKKVDADLLQQSRYTHLLTFLEQNIEKQNKEVQEESLHQSLKALAEKEKIQHQIVNDTLSFLMQSMESRKKELEYHQTHIKEKMEVELKAWVSNQLFEKEKESLLKELANVGLLSQTSAYNSISTKMEKYISSEYVGKILENKFSELNSVFQEEWKEALASVEEKISLEEKSFYESQNKLYENKGVSLHSYLPQTENMVADGAIKGASIGGAYGFAAAAYAAVLGPSAATVTLGAALGAVMAPVLIVGAVTGIAVKFTLGNKKKKEYSLEIRKAFDEAKEKISHAFLPAMLKQFESQSITIASDTCDKLYSFMSQGWTEPELVELQHRIQVYQRDLSTWEQKHSEKILTKL